MKNYPDDEVNDRGYREYKSVPYYDKNSGSQEYLVGDQKMVFGSGPPPVHVQRPQHRSLNDPDGITFIKYLLFAYNLIFFLCGCTLLGVGIWIAVDRSFMATITGNPLYAVAAYIVIAAGGIIFIVSFLGCCGAMTENRLMLTVFSAILVLAFFILFIAAILAIAFRSQLGESIQETMTDTLKDNYGVELHDDFNRAVTKAWDKAQEKLRCCGVLTEGWLVYRETKWFKRFGAKDGLTELKYTYEKQKPYVPRSCCVRDRFHRYINQEVCQKWRLGPPAQQQGAINRALYYQGCYDAGVNFVEENSDILIGLAITFALLMILGIVLSIMMIRKIPKYDQ